MELLTKRIITDTFSPLRLSLVPSLLRQNPAESAFSYFFLISPSTMSASVSIISLWISLDVYFVFCGIPLAMLARFSSFSKVYSINFRKRPEAMSSSAASCLKVSAVSWSSNSFRQRNLTALPTQQKVSKLAL